MIEKHICQLLEQEEGFVLATILSQKGSTPRLPGTKMIIRTDGNIIGTIGGGLTEAQVIEMASEIFKTKVPLTRVFHLNTDIAERMGMICGGELEILLEWVKANLENRQLFESLLNFIQKRRKSILITALVTENEILKRVERTLVADNCPVQRNPYLSDVLLSSLMERIQNQRVPMVITENNQRFLIEPCSNPGTVYLFGAGHVSQPTAILCKMVGFQTVALDDREDFANLERFPNADEIKVIASFEAAFSDLNIDQDSYLVILTRGHQHDKIVLEKALRTPAGYIGMIGSHQKRDAIYHALLTEGFSEDDLKQVHSPIGLNIGANTPEEIAVSIVSELIKIRASKKYKALI